MNNSPYLGYDNYDYALPVYGDGHVDSGYYSVNWDSCGIYYTQIKLMLRSPYSPDSSVDAYYVNDDGYDYYRYVSWNSGGWNPLRTPEASMVDGMYTWMVTSVATTVCGGIPAGYIIPNMKVSFRSPHDRYDGTAHYIYPEGRIDYLAGSNWDSCGALRGSMSATMRATWAHMVTLTAAMYIMIPDSGGIYYIQINAAFRSPDFNSGGYNACCVSSGGDVFSYDGGVH